MRRALQGGIAKDEGAIWIEIESAATVVRCARTEAGLRLVGLGERVALFAREAEDWEYTRCLLEPCRSAVEYAGRWCRNRFRPGREAEIPARAGRRSSCLAR